MKDQRRGSDGLHRMDPMPTAFQQRRMSAEDILQTCGSFSAHHGASVHHRARTILRHTDGLDATVAAVKKIKIDGLGGIEFAKMGLDADPAFTRSAGAYLRAGQIGPAPR